jgi:hypothetical protein
LNLYGLLAHVDELAAEPWLMRVLQIEETERGRRGFKRRLDNAKLGAYKPMADFEYDWPEELDRALLEDLFTLEFLQRAANIVIVGPNGLGKTMIAKHLLHQAVLLGHTARFPAASDMLHDSGNGLSAARGAASVRPTPHGGGYAHSHSRKGHRALRIKAEDARFANRHPGQQFVTGIFIIAGSTA